MHEPITAAARATRSGSSAVTAGKLGVRSGAAKHALLVVVPPAALVVPLPALPPLIDPPLAAPPLAPGKPPSRSAPPLTSLDSLVVAGGLWQPAKQQLNESTQNQPCLIPASRSQPTV